MRFGLVGLLLSSGILLAQSNTGSIELLIFSSFDVTNESFVSLLSRSAGASTSLGMAKTKHGLSSKAMLSVEREHLAGEVT